MARQNIAYLVSDEWNAQRRHQPRDHYLRLGKALLETYYAPPLGNHRIVYVNSLNDIVDDLAQRFRGGKDKVGNLTVVLHGAMDPASALRFQDRINLPISGRGQNPLNLEELRYGLNNLEIALSATRQTRNALTDLRRQRIDGESTLTFAGCFFGTQQGILDALRDFLGGKLTVFAPKHYQGLGLKRTREQATLDNMTQLVNDLESLGLLSVPSDLFTRERKTQSVGATLLKRLGEVKLVPEGGVEAQSLQALGVVPVMYLLPRNALKNSNAQRIYPQYQRVGSDWGVSAPRGQGQSPAQLNNRLRQTFPGGLPPLPVAPQPKTGPQRIQQKRPAGSQAPSGTQGALAGLAGVRPLRVVPGQPNPIQAQMARQRQAEEARRRAAEDASRRAREEAARRTHEEALRRSREEAARRAREEAARRVRFEAENRAREEAARRAREEAARRAREEAARRAREEAQRRALAQQLARIRAPIRSTVRPEFWPRPKPKPPKPPPVTVEFGPVTITRIRTTPPKPRTPPYVTIGGPVTIRQPGKPTQSINIPGKWYIKK